jgi:glycosyltransferase involved in cell wall biosynthesis
MPAPRRSGCNALYLIPGGVGGTEIYVRNLLRALAEIDHRNEYFVFSNLETGGEICPRADNFHSIVSPVPARFRPARLVWEQTILPLQTVVKRLDVLFSPGFSSPALSWGRRVTVIHDLQHKNQPKNFGFFERLAWDLMVWVSARRSHVLMTASEDARRDIARVYGIPEGDIRLFRHGAEPEFFTLQEDDAYGPALPSEAGVPQCRYLLAVSTTHPHKNWERLIGAYALLVEQGREEHLVIAGLKGKSWDGVQRVISERGLSGRVHMPGWQPRHVLLGLFKYAEMLVFPSTFEGFGLPVIEAMAAGIPVVCSDIGPLRETASGAALFFDPASSEEMAGAIESVLDDPERQLEMVRAGMRRAGEFTWTRCAEQTLRVMLEAAMG